MNHNNPRNLTYCISPIYNTVALKLQAIWRPMYLMCIALWLLSFLCIALPSCSSSNDKSEIRIIRGKTSEVGFHLLKIEKSVFRGAAAEDVTIVLEVGNRDGDDIVLLEKPPEWRLIESDKNDLSSLGDVQLLIEKREDYDVVSVSVFVRGSLILNKVLPIGSY